MVYGHGVGECLPCLNFVDDARIYGGDTAAREGLVGHCIGLSYQTMNGGTGLYPSPSHAGGYKGCRPPGNLALVL